jgi:arginine decarboxylase
MGKVWRIPDLLCFFAGAAEGITPLNAFDNALLSAGCANWNLVRVSSIIPKGVKILEEPPLIPFGSLVPTVYASITGEIPGELISACIGAGVAEDGGGIIMEYSHYGPASVAEAVVREMLEEGGRKRGMEFERIILRSTEHKVERLGCAVAAAVFWWEGVK